MILIDFERKKQFRGGVSKFTGYVNTMFHEGGSGNFSDYRFLSILQTSKLFRGDQMCFIKHSEYQYRKLKQNNSVR